LSFPPASRFTSLGFFFSPPSQPHRRQKKVSFDGKSWWDQRESWSRTTNMEGRETGSLGLRKAGSLRGLSNSRHAGLEPAGTKWLLPKRQSSFSAPSTRKHFVCIPDVGRPVKSRFARRGCLFHETRHRGQRPGIECSAGVCGQRTASSGKQSRRADGPGTSKEKSSCISPARHLQCPARFAAALRRDLANGGSRYAERRRHRDYRDSKSSIPWIFRGPRMSLNRAHPSMDLADRRI